MTGSLINTALALTAAALWAWTLYTACRFLPSLGCADMAAIALALVFLVIGAVLLRHAVREHVA